MKKSSFFLILIAIFAYFGFISCGPDYCDREIIWNNQNQIYFSPIKLSVQSHYYSVGWGGNYSKMLIDADSSIEDFYDVFQRPVKNDAQHISKNSSIKTVTWLNGCYISTYALNASIDQMYKNIDDEQVANHSLPASAISSSSTTTMSFGSNSLDTWRSDRNPNYHNVDFEVTSGNYETDYGQLVKLVWKKSFTKGDVSDMSYSTNGTATTVNAGSLNITGSAINVTPNKPFVHRIYEGSVMVERTIENIVLSNNEMGLVVK